jgi:integrase
VLPELGRVRLAEIDTPMLNRFVEMLVLTKGLSPSSCRNAVNPVRAILRRHVALGDLPVNAASGVMLPAARGGRVRSLSMDEIYAYIGAAPECDRAIWSTALLCGLRRGELGALQHSEMSMDRDAPRITVAASYDWPTWERVETKSRAGRRTVPIPSRLYEILAEHGMSTRRSGDDLVFGRTARTPFAPTAVSKRADAAWENAKLPGLTLHEARHCYASWVLAAGVQPVVLQGWLGHSTLSTTLNIYSHALPNADTYSAGLLEAAL